MDGHNLKLIGGKDIESESSIVEYETSYTERYKDNNIHNKR